MDRKEFMDKAEKEISQILITHKNRMMNIVQQAWAEGKRNAEIDSIVGIIKDALYKAEESEAVDFAKEFMSDEVHDLAKQFRSQE